MNAFFVFIGFSGVECLWPSLFRLPSVDDGRVLIDIKHGRCHASEALEHSFVLVLLRSAPREPGAKRTTFTHHEPGLTAVCLTHFDFRHDGEMIGRVRCGNPNVDY